MASMGIHGIHGYPWHPWISITHVYTLHMYIGVRGVPERRIFFPGAFGTGVGCEFPFPSVLVLLPPTHCRSPSSLSESAISIGKMAFFGDGSPRNLGAMQIS